MFPRFNGRRAASQRTRASPRQYRIKGAFDEIPEEYRTCIYRVVQECLTNALKHANAKAVKVELREANSVLEVAVSDDGSGFQNGGPHAGMGLIGMEERVRELGGNLRVESTTGLGTSVMVRLSIP